MITYKLRVVFVICGIMKTPLALFVVSVGKGKKIHCPRQLSSTGIAGSSSHTYGVFCLYFGQEVCIVLGAFDPADLYFSNSS